MAVKTELEKPYRLCLGYRAVADDTAWKKSASVQESQWQHAFVSPTEATAENRTLVIQESGLRSTSYRWT